MMEKEQFQITLLFPPLWLPEIPYLSLPALTAYLEQAGYYPVQRDLNIEFWRHFYREDQLKEIYRWSKETYLRLKKQAGDFLHEDDTLEFMVKLRMMFLEDTALPKTGILNFKTLPFPSEDEFIEKIKRGSVEKHSFRDLCRTFWKATALGDTPGSRPASQWESHIKYHDYFFTDVSLSHYAQSTQGISKILDDERRNPYISHFSQNTAASIIEENPHLIGISIIAINQVVPAFSLAKLVKQALPRVHITIGGPWCTHLKDKLLQQTSLFDWIDSMVVFEGEEALLRLAEALRGDGDLSAVPNLMYKEGDRVRINPIHYDQDLDALPTPDFRGLPLGSYEFPGVFPLRGSRGCSWHRCAFCSYPVIDPVYRARDPHLVVRDMKTLVDKFGVQEFSFTDSVFDPDHIGRISQLIRENQLDTQWLGFARFDKKMTAGLLQKMAAAGCRVLLWGLESGCRRILKSIKKGSTPAMARRILADAANAGIHNRPAVMYGFPTETAEEVEATIRFIEDNLPHIHSLAFGFLTVEFNTPMAQNPRDFSLDFEENPGYNLSLGYNHRTMFGVNELQQLETRFRELCFAIERFHQPGK